MSLTIIIFGGIAAISTLLAIMLWVGHSRTPPSEEFPGWDTFTLTFIALASIVFTAILLSR
jgi:uncharacterized membrane protein